MAGGTPSQPSEGESRRPTALEVWLRHEHLPRSERIDRLTGDAELEASLREQGFEGNDWDFFVNVLAEYGVGVFAGWISHRVVVKKCAEKKIRVPTLPEHVTSDYDAVSEIAADTVGDAINHFRDDVLVPEVWDPKKGASLKTFFIGQCMRRYGNAARRWQNNFQAPRNETATEDLAVLNAGRVSDVDDDAIRTLRAQEVFRSVRNPRAARALAMDALKYTNAEIAADLGIGVEAAKSLLKRARADIRNIEDNTEGRRA